MDSPIGIQPKLHFLGFSVIKVEFRADQDAPEEEQVELGLEPAIHFRDEAKTHFDVIFKLGLEGKDRFLLRINSFGSFMLEGDVTEDEREGFVRLNAPAIVFPYLRAYVTQFTSNLGLSMTPVVLHPMFFHGRIPDLEVPAPTGETQS